VAYRFAARTPGRIAEPGSGLPLTMLSALVRHTGCGMTGQVPGA